MDRPQDLFESSDSHTGLRGDPWQREPWKPHGEKVWAYDLQVGDEVIVEVPEMKYTGYSGSSKYYRCIVNEHATVSGRMKTINSEPDDEFPAVPPWQLGWLYLGVYLDFRYWKRGETKCVSNTRE